MGLFDLFKGKARGVEPAVDKNVARLGRVAGDRHAQNYDRQEALDALARLATAEAAEALLKRFTFHIDPSITDQEEKETAYRGVLAAGEPAIAPIRAFCAKAESLTWPLRCMKELLPADRYEEEVVALLGRHDTEYARNTDPRVQLLGELESCRSDRARVAAERFLEDVGDPVRFAAVTTVFAQEDAASVPALARTLAGEESMRIKAKIAEGLLARGWPIPEPDRDAVARALPSDFALDAAGKVRRS